MKKIMFNDKFGLTEAVLSGRKTMTRRVVKFSDIDAKYLYDEEWNVGGYVLEAIIDRYARFKVGEVVAVAQNYKDAGVNYLPEEDDEFGCYNFPAEQTNGWTNKMFVRADLMPHQIRITNVRVERLQDISDEGCIAEGIEMWRDLNDKEHYCFFDKRCKGFFPYSYSTPREAYAALIDRISGKETFERNPYVFVYEFELIK